MKRSRILQGVVAALLILLLILDTKTAIIGAQEGITICLKTVIPSLLPFITITSILGSAIIGSRWKVLKPFCRWLGIPEGAESIPMLGFISGYPVGAQMVTAAYKNGTLERSDACRMLGFCSNAGPAFIFGIFGSMFTNAIVPWALWFTHILSALLVAAVLPGKAKSKCVITSYKETNVSESLENALKVMAMICGWVVIFRILITYLNRWLYWFLPVEAQVLVSGALELANGCINLSVISSDGAKFLLAGAMLALGGVCVAMQTVSVTQGLGCGQYFPGKVMQTAFSLVLNIVAQHHLFPEDEVIKIPLILIILIGLVPILCIVVFKKKKVVAFA